MERIIRNIPNAITCLNLASGVIAIIFASKGEQQIGSLAAYQWAYICIGIAAVADFFDGFAARLLHAYSDLGKELDSLCDLVSFGVAPAMILFNCLDNSLEHLALSWIAILIPVCGALRLAKFNIDTRQATTFIGLPIPANAIFWIGFTAYLYPNPERISVWVAVATVLIFSWLMISPLKMLSLKFKSFGFKGNQFRYLLIACAVVFIFCMGVEGLMWLIIAYVLISRINKAYA